MCIRDRPTTAPLVGMLMLGNLFKESGVVKQLSETASNALMYIVVILLGTSVGATTSAEAVSYTHLNKGNLQAADALNILNGPGSDGCVRFRASGRPASSLSPDRKISIGSGCGQLRHGQNLHTVQ